MPARVTGRYCPCGCGSTQPSRFHRLCLCGCNEWTRSAFVNSGHHHAMRAWLTDAADYRLSAIAVLRDRSIVPYGSTDAEVVAEARGLLRTFGWLEEQGYGSYGTGDVTRSDRSERRQTRLYTQLERNTMITGDRTAYAPDAPGMRSTGNTARIATRFTGQNVPAYDAVMADNPPEVTPRTFVQRVNDTARRITRREAVAASADAQRPYATSGDTNPMGAFGVEFEYARASVSRQELARMITDALQRSNDPAVRAMRCEAQSYNHTDSTSVIKITTDATVPYGGEIVTPILHGQTGYRVLRIICDVAAIGGVGVSQQAGLHVHHNARPLTHSAMVQVANIYYHAQRHITAFMPDHRIGNRWAAELTERENNEIQNGRILNFSCQHMNNQRYHDVNFQALLAHGSIEFRQHNGTFAYEAVANWVRLTGAIMRHARLGFAIETGDYATLESWLTALDCEERTIAYYRKRTDRKARGIAGRTINRMPVPV